MPGGSGHRLRLSRAGLTDFVAVILGAFVRLSAWLSSRATDRSPTPLADWPITRADRTPTDLYRRAERRTDVMTFNDRIGSAEPPASSIAAYQETRNSDHRHSARNGGGYPQRRPARRTTG